MENKPKKSKALIITIILIILLLVVGYLLFKNRDSFGVKTSAGIAKIFSPLIPSQNTKDLTQVEAQAGEDIKKGDSVSIFGTGTNNNPIVVKTGTNNGNIFGYANQDIKSGNMGEILKYNNNGSNSFWNSFSDFIGNIFNKKPICSDKKDNDGDGLIDEKDPNCHVGGVLTGDYVPTHFSESSNPIDGGNGDFTPQCSDTKDNDGDKLIDEKDPDCHVGGVLTGDYVPTHYSESTPPGGNFPTVKVTADPQSIAKGGTSTIKWESTNATSCNAGTGNGTGTTGSFSTGALTTSKSYTVTCTGNNGSRGSDNVFVEVAGSKLPDLVADRVTPVSAVINTPTVLSSVIRNIGNSDTTGGTFPNYFIIKNTDTNQSFVSSSPTTSPIAAKSESTIKITNTFVVLGNYTITVCADQISPTNNKGLITESNENNNCSDPVNFKVTDGTDENTLPDLVASSVTPTSTTINTPTTLSSIITNIGGSSTDISFSSYFDIAKVNTPNEYKEIEVVVPKLESTIGSPVTISYTFTTAENYSIRACADKKNRDDAGTITESDELHNCSNPTILTVSNVIPPPCLSPKITDVDTGECIDPGDCLPPKVINGDKCEDATVCTLPKITDVDTGACIDPGDCKPPKVINGSNCEDAPIDPGTPNKCLLIAQHPLEFTDSEKAKLAELLRKFYILSSTLKTDDDIAMIYQDIDKYKALIGNIDDLTQQCYVQTNDGTDYTAFRNKNPNLNLPAWSDTNGGKVFKTDGTYLAQYSGLTIRGGNPWFNYDKRVSYIPDDPTIKEFTRINPNLQLPVSVISKKSTCEGKITYNSSINLFDPLICGIGVHNMSPYLPPGTNLSLAGMGCIAGMSCQYFYDNYTYPDIYRNGDGGQCANQIFPATFSGGDGNDASYATGCNFNPKTDIREYEKLLNIW